MSLLLFVACAPPTGARAWQMTSLAEGVGGPKATAEVGDFRLENEHLTLAITGPRYSLGPSPYGGTIADVDRKRPDQRWDANHGNDQFAEMFGTVNMNIAAADEEGEVFILNDGSNGEAAVVRVDAPATGLLELLNLLWDFLPNPQPDFRITNDYVLEPGAEVLKIRTQVSFIAEGEALPEAELLPGTDTSFDLLTLAVDSGVALGDFYLQGGSVDVFGPGLGFNEDLAVYEAAEGGRNLFDDPFAVPFLGGTADGVSYGIAGVSGNLYVPLFTSSQTAAFAVGKEGDGSRERFPAGAAFAYERYLAVGDGDMGSVYDKLAAARGDVVGKVAGYVVEEATGLPLSGASVLAYQPGADKPWTQWRTDVGEDTQIDGSFGGSLPPGDWELLVHKRGRPDSGRVSVRVEEGALVELVLGSPQAGQVDIAIVDERGRPMPGKVTFTSDTVALDSTKGDSYIGGAPAEVVFVPHGETTVVLPPGTYTATATRGLEYEIDSQTFTVSATGRTDLTLQLLRNVDTTGYVSADFHVHAGNSFDSGVRPIDRVVTMASEGVEFFASTDHDYITDYAPMVEELGLEAWIKTTTGLETTTLELGHFLGFPLQHDTLAPGGGAFDWTGMPPQEILDTLAELGKPEVTPVRFVAHPRDGILGYFDQYGYDPYAAEVVTPLTATFTDLLSGDYFTWDFEALEILNGKRYEIARTPTQAELDAYATDESALDYYSLTARTMAEQADLSKGTYRLGYGHEGQVDDWFTLLNQGIRLTALGNSDTHGRHSVEAGCPRNYVGASTDDPAGLQDADIAEAVIAGNVVASYGPFIRYWANDPSHPTGSEVVDGDGTVTLHIQVEAPTWMAVDRVELYQNGTLIKEYTGLDSGVVRLSVDEEIPVALDSWFVVIAVGNGSLAPLFTPVEMPPVELQDVVVDALAGIIPEGSLLSGVLVPPVPIPRTGNVLPFALTNPIYVDLDGAGWTPPGQAPWMLPPIEPEE